MPGWIPTVGGLAALGSLLWAAHGSRARGAAWVVVWIVGLTAVTLVLGRRAAAGAMVFSTRPWVPLLAGWSALTLSRRSLPVGSEAALSALACMTALVSLVQFPVNVDGYIFYFAPLAVLCAGLLFVALPRGGAPAGVAALALYAAWLVLNSNNLVESSTARIELPRGGLRVPPEEAAAYERLVRTLDSLDVGPTILALPDIPQVYFLAARRNPTPVLFDVYEDPAARLAQVRRATAASGLRAVVLSDRIGLSGPLDPELRAFVDSAFPMAIHVPPFEVRTAPGTPRDSTFSETPAPRR
jgi:hypothetical protein